MALSGGLHSGKNGLAAYSANVIATIACVVGLETKKNCLMLNALYVITS